MYFRPYSTVYATDPEETVTAFGQNGDLRCVDGPVASNVTVEELFAPFAELWRQYFNMFG